MMKNEFEKLANLEISLDDYENIIEPMYMATDMDKADFVRFIRPSAKALAKKYAEQKRAENERTAFFGYGGKTMNGCWFIGRWFRILNTRRDRETGKTLYFVRETTLEEQRETGFDRFFSDHVDVDYRDVIVIEQS